MVLYKHSNRPDHDCIFPSIYDEHQAQICNFIKVAVTRWVCTTVCGQAHWTRLSLLQLKFCSKGNQRLQSSRRRLLANEFTCAYRTNQKYHMQKTSKPRNHFLFPAQTNWWWLPIWSRIVRRKRQNETTTILYHINIQNSWWTKRQLGTTWSFRDRGSCAMPKIPKISQTKRNSWH